MPRLAKVLESRAGDGSCTGNRYVVAEVGGERYRVNILKGRVVRIAFARRGENWGHKWACVVVRISDGKRICDKPCTRDIGVDAALKLAGVLPTEGR